MSAADQIAKARDMLRKYDAGLKAGGWLDVFKTLRAVTNSADALGQENAKLRALLAELEAANQELAAGRSHKACLQMLEDGQERSLDWLDAARKSARVSLGETP